MTLHRLTVGSESIRVDTTAVQRFPQLALCICVRTRVHSPVHVPATVFPIWPRNRTPTGEHCAETSMSSLTCTNDDLRGTRRNAAHWRANDASRAATLQNHPHAATSLGQSKRRTKRRPFSTFGPSGARMDPETGPDLVLFHSVVAPPRASHSSRRCAAATTQSVSGVRASGHGRSESLCW